MTSDSNRDISQVLIAVVQVQDSDLVENALGEQHIKFTKLPSAGGFLRERNVTFLIGCAEATIEKITNLLMNSAKKRVTFISTPTENGPLPMPIPTETVVGGVSLFRMDIDHFEEI